MYRIWKTEQKDVAAYDKRNSGREITLLSATMNFVGYFMGLGDDQPTAEDKVTQLSSEVAAYLYVYTLGNKTPLIDAINASALVFMDMDAKNFIINELSL